MAIGRPLHGRADAVSIAEIDIIAHADLIAVIDDWRPGHREQQAVQQLDLESVISQQRCQAAANAEIDRHARVRGVEAPEIVTLAPGYHLERQLVSIAQEARPS